MASYQEPEQAKREKAAAKTSSDAKPQEARAAPPAPTPVITDWAAI